MATLDNNITELGSGAWMFQVYAPEARVGPIQGLLRRSKDFHTVVQDSPAQAPSNSAYRPLAAQEKILATFPSQNVAYVYDSALVKLDQD